MSTRLSRRNFLGGVAALGATGLIAKSELAAQSSPSRRRSIDVHHHIVPPAHRAFLAAHGQKPSIEWELSKDLADMDKGGTATAILTIGAPDINFGDDAGIRKVARECNDYFAKLRSDYPGRFGFFTTLPLPDVEGSLRETEYALDTLKADGVCMWTNYDKKWLGDASFAPLYEELNRRKAVVYTHPKEAACCRDLVANISVAVIEYGTNTARGIASLIYGGTTRRFPDMKFIFSHGGGTAPYLISRMDRDTAAYLRDGGKIKAGAPSPRVSPAMPRGVVYELQRFYYDTVSVENQVSLSGLRRFVPLSQILYGTDHPWGGAVERGGLLDASEAFTAQELQAIYRDNALKLLPQLQRS